MKSNSRRATQLLKSLAQAKHFVSLFLMGVFCIACASPLPAQSGAQPISKSFDFRNGAQGWQAGFSDYAPATDTGFYQLLSEMRSLPPELSVNGTGFYIQGNNHSDDLFMFLKRRLDQSDGIVPGQTYRVTFTLVFASNAQTGCVGVGGPPGEGVYLKAGASPTEPKALLSPRPSDPRDFSHLQMNVDKSNQSQSGIAASVTGNIANGQPCTPGNTPYVSLQRTHQHTSLVNASSQGELWLLVGTDSGFEAKTALYYQRIDVTLTPDSQQAPVLLTYLDRRYENSGKASALDSVSMMSEPFPVISARNLFSPDQRTRINLFAYNLQLRAGENATGITVEAEDALHQIHVLPIEAVNEVPNFNWITQVTVKLPDQLQSAGTVSMAIKLRGTSSNKLPVSIQ